MTSFLVSNLGIGDIFDSNSNLLVWWTTHTHARTDERHALGGRHAHRSVLFPGGFSDVDVGLC